MAIEAIGRPTPKVESVDKVTGRARYTADIVLEGALWGRVMHSPYAHARIVSIDTSAARALPGVVAVITGDDVGDGYYGGLLKDVPPLARGVVRFSGERVAAVAAEDEETALRALDLIEVEYEELPAVFEPDEALAPGAPVLHPAFNSYPGVTTERVGPMMPILPLETPSNAYNRSRVDRGDLEAGFAAADLIVENTYRTQRQHQGYLEPQNCLIDIDDEGLVHIWAGSKAPYGTRNNLAAAIGVPVERLVFHPATIGGDFGGKGSPFNLPLCYFLAKAAGRPVRIVAEYLEEFLAGNPRHATEVTLRTGVMRDGTLVAHHVNFVVNAGAYAGFKPAGRIFGPDQSAGPYRIPNTRIESAHVYTNTVPGGYLRGPGEGQGMFALESHLDEIALRLGIDPVELRLKNLAGDMEENAMGHAFAGTGARDALVAVADAAGYRAPKAPNIGRGVALGERPAGGGTGNAAITLRPDGGVILGTPVYDQGVGVYTFEMQIIAEEMQVAFDDIELEVWDSGRVAFDSGIAGSWATKLGTGATHAAVVSLREALKQHAVDKLGWPEDATSVRGGEVWRSDLEERMTWQELLEQTGESVTGEGRFQGTQFENHVTGFAAQVAEVEVDPETGHVRLLKFTSAHDVARVLNPLAHQGQINGGIVQGIGYALMEDLTVEDGRVTSLTFGDYKLPTIRDLPELKTLLVEAEQGVGPYNVKAIGEVPMSPVAAAIANAIADASGARVRELPLTAERVYRELQSK
ncbi:MAG: xanthine dehydrogenase family protein molybdopterin-binding subunit [Dehalococcoidia bacterium]